MSKRLVKILVLSIFVVGMVFVYSIASSKFAKLKYTSLDVEIPEGTPRYIDEDGIRKLVDAYIPNLKEEPTDSINLNDLELYLESVSAIRDAEVCKVTEGEKMSFETKLVVKVMQREPLLRVIGNGANYYMDDEGVKIDANDEFAAKVLLVTGNAKDEFVKEQLLPMVAYVDDSEFWQAQIKHIQVMPNGHLQIVPLLGKQLIKFGEPQGYKEKLRNLKALYGQGFEKLGWDKYKIIDLRYKGQVVCVER